MVSRKMNNCSDLLKYKLSGILDEWQDCDFPSRYEIESSARELLEWKKANGIASFWDERVTMLTATLDDALGQGIKTIEMFAEVAGIEVISLGILQSPETIIDSCTKLRPSLLGLTVLRTYAYDDLLLIGKSIPTTVKFIAGGGPFLQTETELVRQARIDFVARDVTSFLDFLLTFQPDDA